MDLGLTDKVFVVTAASSGLGRATAETLLAEGARVVVVARRGELLDEMVLAASQDRAAALPADLTDDNTAQRAVDLALSRFGAVSGAFISVGGPPKGTVVENTDEQWRMAFDSVVLGGLRVARAVIEAATEPPVLGWVLSTSAKVPLPAMAISNALRPGLAVLIKQLSDEIGPEGGRAFGLLPGTISTERIGYLHGLTGDPEAARQAAEQSIPLRRLGEPAEFGRVAAFLLSPAAGYVTGCVLPVDGGVMRAL